MQTTLIIIAILAMYTLIFITVYRTAVTAYRKKYGIDNYNLVMGFITLIILLGVIYYV